MANTHLQSLLQKEVSRKEFLGILGLALASIFGIGHLLQLLTGKSLEKSHQNLQDGYGSAVYGGKKDV
jgi:hypothetical protein